MSELKNGWFIQQDRTRPGVSFSLKVKEVIAENSELAVFQTDVCGLIMTSASGGMIRYASDDVAAREMTAHCAAFAHEDPARALILNGSDCALAGELLRQRSIEQIDICEMEDDAADWANRYLPDAKTILHDPHVELYEERTFDAFLREHEKAPYDLVYATCSEAPSKVGSYLKSLKSALTPNGILTIRCATFFRAPERARAVVKGMHKLFRYASFALCPSPVHPGGSIMFCLGSDTFNGARPIRHPMRFLSHRLKYYSAAYHKAIFEQPVFPKMKRDFSDEDDYNESERIV